MFHIKNIRDVTLIKKSVKTSISIFVSFTDLDLSSTKTKTYVLNSINVVYSTCLVLINLRLICFFKLTYVL